MAEALLEIDALTKRFGGVVASDGDFARASARRTACADRPERRRQDHADRAIDRRDRARQRPHPLRCPRHHGAAGLSAQPARAGALVSDRLAVSRIHRARQCRARGSGACRPFVPLLARRAARAAIARAGPCCARSRRPGAARRRAGRRSQPRRTSPARNCHGAGDPAAHAVARRTDGRHGPGGIRAAGGDAAAAQGRPHHSSGRARHGRGVRAGGSHQRSGVWPHRRLRRAGGDPRRCRRARGLSRRAGRGAAGSWHG